MTKCIMTARILKHFEVVCLKKSQLTRGWGGRFENLLRGHSISLMGCGCCRPSKAVLS